MATAGPIRVSRDRLIGDLEELGKIGARDGRGRTRPVFSPEDREARDFLMKRMKEADLRVRVDQVGNIIGRREGSGRGLPAVAFGSHIDTVPDAGMLDGCYGVLGALEVVRTLNDNGVTTRFPLEVIAFSNEEGVRFPLMIGSQVVSGQMTLEDAYQLKDTSGVSYLQALQSWRVPTDLLVPARREAKEFKLWLELHIEQGPVLEAARSKIGIVEMIVGVTHLIVKFKGEAGHAGTTPMEDRHDALRGAARVVLDVGRIARETGPQAVGTVGKIEVQPGALNIIPGQAEIGIDFRDVSPDTMDAGVGKIKDAIEAACTDSELTYTVEERARLVPTPMSKDAMRSIENAARGLGVSYTIMPSGAGHDTQNMARLCDVGMIFVPSRHGISHSPLEWTDPEDLELGANVLLRVILESAEQAVGPA